LSCGHTIIAQKYINQPKAHASLLAQYIQDILKENNLTIEDCAAVAVSEGPGSYTGLRVGVSCAKGLCYGAKKPLIAVSTPAILTQLAIDQFLQPDHHTQGANTNNPAQAVSNPTQQPAVPTLIVPMIDARRMEVYTATFNADGEQLSKTEALVLNETSFAEELRKGKVLFIGNGALKFQPLVAQNPNALFAEQHPQACGMRIYAATALKNKKFEDCAYFEPFYLKEFIAGKPKKLL
ncbi:MAG: tRNA (adenosine(37)-N6)-threonylcarbamoyltransferase complex dimerization subunit type 1 TsaB, partial [Bacteroidales bacterium]